MRTLFGASALATIFFSMGGFAYAQQNTDTLQIWGGGAKEASFYSGTLVPLAEKAIKTLAFRSYSWGGVSPGCPANMQQVTTDPQDLAFCQLDMVRAAQNNGSFTGQIIRADIGDECLYLATQEGGRSFGDFVADAALASVLTAGATSGSAGTLAVLTGHYKEYNPDLELLDVINTSGAADAMEKLANGDAPFAFFVQSPDPASKPFEIAAQNGLHFVPVWHDELADLGYELKSLPVTSASWSWSGGAKAGERVTTACTKIALITGDPTQIVDEKERRRHQLLIDKIAGASAQTFQPTDNTSWLEVAAGIQSVAVSTATDLADAANERLNQLRN